METIILLLSKYSENCNKMINMMKSSGINFSFIETIFVDNARLRQSILDKKDYNITTVPTILVFKDNYKVEKYDGVNAFQWVEKTVENLKRNEVESTSRQVDAQVEAKVNEQLRALQSEFQEKLKSIEEEEPEIMSKPPQVGQHTDINSMLQDKTIEKMNSPGKADEVKSLAEKMEKEREDLFPKQEGLLGMMPPRV
jgi:thiol-disulfide isomerase/thioredoxin